MRTAADILGAKPDQTLYTTEPSASVLDAAALMVDANIGALVVMDAGNVVGLVTERDFVRHAVRTAEAGASLQVRDIMTAPVTCVQGDRTSDECMTLMTNIRYRHLPVRDGRTLRGVVSIGDLVKDVISDQCFTIRQLEQYITG
jgi:CBS domain-containing protein